MFHDTVDDDPSATMNAVLRGCYERQVLHKFGGPPKPDAEDAAEEQAPKFAPGGDGGARMSMPMAPPDPNAWFRRAAMEALEAGDSPAFVVVPGAER